MSKSRQDNRARPNLFVEIEDFQRKINDFKEIDNHNNVTIKPLRSAKNGHELKHFNFDEGNLDRVNTSRKIQKLQLLEQEKSNLMHSLEILKASAVSAIAEKEDEIQKLREIDHFNIEEKLEFYEGELYRSHKLRIQLEDEKQQLYRQFRQERSKYTSELEEKQYLIDQLHDEIADVRRELELFEQNDLSKTKRIKLLQEENSLLSFELQEISLSNSLREITERMDLDETVRINVPSVVSSIHSQNFISMIESSDHLVLDAVDKTYLSEKLDELQKVHKDDIFELKSFYEKRISALRDIYQRQLNLPTEESEKEESICRSKMSKKSSRRNFNEKRSNYHANDHTISINLRDMYSIEEHAEELLETERIKRHDLKYEIKMQNLSECPSVQPRMRTQQDMVETESATSHFTAKYFENPYRFMKKNKSSSTFNREEEKTVLKVKRDEEMSDLQPVTQLVQNEYSEDFWSKTKIFAAGMISGVTITAIASILLKKS